MKNPSRLLTMFTGACLAVNAIAQIPSSNEVERFNRAAAENDVNGLQLLRKELAGNSDKSVQHLGILAAAVAEFRDGKRQACLQWLDSLEQVASPTERFNLAVGMKFRCMVAADLGYRQQAMELADRALLLLDTAAYIDEHIATNVMKAEAMLELPDFEGAQQLLHAMHGLSLRHHRPRGYAVTLVSMGAAAFLQERYLDAKRLWWEAYTRAPTTADLVGITALSNYTSACIQLKEYAPALNTLDSLIASLGNSSQLHRAGLWHRKGFVRSAMKDYPAAIADLRIAISLCDSVGDETVKVKVLQALANATWKNGDQDEALLTLNSALAMARRMNQAGTQKEMHLKLHRWHAELGEAEQALDHHRAYAQLADSLNGARFTEQLAFSEVRFETAQKERRIVEQDQALQLAQAEDRRKSIQRNALIGATALLAVIALLLYRSIRARQRLAQKERELHSEQVDQLLAQQELKSINAMLDGQEKERDRMGKDLHDRLGSMLGGIKANMAALEDRLEQVRDDLQYQKVNRLLDQTVSELRQISHDMAAATLSRFGLEKALKDLRDTLHISGRLHVELKAFGLDQRLERSVEIAVYRMVQELVSNVLKHAKANDLIIGVTRTPGRLSVVVSDNGVGYDTEQQTDGMGLGNVRSRAAALGATVQVDSTPGKGTTVSVECPVVE